MIVVMRRGRTRASFHDGLNGEVRGGLDATSVWCHVVLLIVVVVFAVSVCQVDVVVRLVDVVVCLVNVVGVCLVVWLT